MLVNMTKGYSIILIGIVHNSGIVLTTKSPHQYLEQIPIGMSVKA